MTRMRCARCNALAGFVVTAGDVSTFWYRSESVCLSCLPKSKRWAGFVGPVTVESVGELGGVPVQGTLFDLGGREVGR